MMKKVFILILLIYSNCVFSSDFLLCKSISKGLSYQSEYIPEGALFAFKVKKDLSYIEKVSENETKMKSIFRDNLNVVSGVILDRQIDHCEVKSGVKENLHNRNLNFQNTLCKYHQEEMIYSHDPRHPYFYTGLGSRTPVKQIAIRDIEETVLLSEDYKNFSYYLNEDKYPFQANCYEENSMQPPNDSLIMDVNIIVNFPQYTDYNCTYLQNKKYEYNSKNVDIKFSSINKDSIQIETKEFSSANCLLKDSELPKQLNLVFGANYAFKLTPDKFSPFNYLNITFKSEKIGGKVVIISQCTWDHVCGLSGSEIRTALEK